MTMLHSWLGRARLCHVAEVAGQLGFEVLRSSSADHCRCPACGAERRHPSRRDRRGAVGISPERLTTWLCYECQAAGDGVDFVAYALAGSRFRELDLERRAEVRAWFEGPHAAPAGRRVRAPSPPPPATRTYPPADAVTALLGSAQPISADADVGAYLASRCVDTAVVELRDLARVLPSSASQPTWARYQRQDWTALGYRVLVPLWNARGVLHSVLARRIAPSAELPKSLPPSGFKRAGLLMACPAARRMLAEPETARAWMGDAELRVVIAEGEIDFLVTASLYGDTHEAVVFGIFSGSWTEEHASRVPDGAVVVIATDDDPDGERYADDIADTFVGRDVALERWRPSMESRLR